LGWDFTGKKTSLFLPSIKEGENSNKSELFMTIDNPSTELIYLKNTFQFETKSTVLEVTETTIILTKTVIYPKGGGQPSDTGI
jgi:alanyl-tRNA synthetase